MVHYRSKKKTTKKDWQVITGSNTLMKQQIYNGNECSFFLPLFSWDDLVLFKQLGSTCISWEDSSTSRTSLGALISWLPTSLILDWWQMTKCRRPISIWHIRWALPRIWPGPYMGQPDYPHLLEEHFSPLIFTSLKKRERDKCLLIIWKGRWPLPLLGNLVIDEIYALIIWKGRWSLPLLLSNLVLDEIYAPDAIAK